jgi:NAD(P)H-hydrate epimerase
MKILTASQMREVDRRTSEVYRIPSLLLMENAGRAVVDALEREVASLYSGPIHVFCGKGNNGGDGLVAARYLSLGGARPVVLLFGDPAGLRGDARANWEIVSALGLEVHSAASPALLASLERADTIIDALFGTGLSKPLGPDFAAVVDWINRSRAYVASVDVPSGLFSDSAEIAGPSVRADLTVTFTALKLALVLDPAASRAGKVVVAPIGSPRALLDDTAYPMEQIDAGVARRAVGARAPDSHKGTFGHVHVVAGSRGKSGAALMTGLGALRSGAGLVTLWVPEGLQRDIVARVPELMSESLPETSEGTSDASGAARVLEAIRGSDALVVGPGLTTASRTVELVRELVRRSSIPVVVDADGLNAFAGDLRSLANEARRPVVITPHPGEMARLVAKTTAEVQGHRLETADSCAREHRLFTILKGHQTIVASPGGRLLINSTGNPGMATAGTGDVLAGIVGRFVGAWASAHAGGVDSEGLADYLGAAVYLHGLAGDLAAKDRGMESLVATDLLPFLPEAFKRVARAGQVPA